MSLIEDHFYRTPTDLSSSPNGIKRIAMIGSCLIGGWQDIFRLKQPTCKCDYFLWAQDITLPETPPPDAHDYDFIVVQIPLRGLIPDHSYFRLNYNDIASYENLLESAKLIITDSLHETLKWNVAYDIPAFVCNILVPQQDPLGRLMPRADVRNMVYFIEKLNEHLALEIQKFRNVYLLDFDALASTFGRKYIQEDMVWQINHGAVLVDADVPLDQDRLEPVSSVHEHYPTRLIEYLRFVVDEIILMYRTLRQIDSVKIVIFDIDDTLWRGVAAERPDGLVGEQSGWPTGIAEAIGYLKRRGVLLAIVSKNTEEVVNRLWPLHWHENVLSLKDFAIKKINWRQKSENVDAILAEAGLLAKNALFVDDNPVERDAVKKAFPEIRVLGGSPYLWRRVLLWSSETQVPQITAESADRTAMVQAQVSRNEKKSSMPRSEWLSSLETKISLYKIDNIKDPRYPRAFELINKTNQFNTTGKRWSAGEMAAALDSGAELFVGAVADKYTNYGLTTVGVLDKKTIVQFVMSCRIIGMDIELAVIALIVKESWARLGDGITALAADTDLNILSRDLFARCGFSLEESVWSLPAGHSVVMPDHVEIKMQDVAMQKAI